MFDKLEDINKRPAPFKFYTAEDLWADEHTSMKMPAYHLDGSIDYARKIANEKGLDVDYYQENYLTYIPQEIDRDISENVLRQVQKMPEEKRTFNDHYLMNWRKDNE